MQGSPPPLRPGEWAGKGRGDDLSTEELTGTEGLLQALPIGRRRASEDRQAAGAPAEDHGVPFFCIPAFPAAVFLDLE